ncbi:MAG: phosphotransferase enzyme family protein [Pirellulaceae bacterium]
MTGMAPDASLAAVLDYYPGLGPIGCIHSLANAGGFSGSRLWRLERDAGDLCLRRWPQEHPSEERLAFIHGVLGQFGQCGLTCIPVPLPSRGGKSFVAYREHFWELAPWMRGKADFHANPTRDRLASVMRTVAQLHRTAEGASPRCQENSPTLLSRRGQLQRLIAGEAGKLASAVQRHPREPLRERGQRLFAHFHRRATFAASKLDEVTIMKGIPLFPVIRDLWHDHILFTGDQVTGIVDFGAMRVDSAACDLSRLLGSLVGNDREAWEFARKAYNSVRPLSADEWKQAQALDEVNVILAGLNWLDWICVQGRVFENEAAVYARLDELLIRLEGARSFPPA